MKKYVIDNEDYMLVYKPKFLMLEENGSYNLYRDVARFYWATDLYKDKEYENLAVRQKRKFAEVV